MFRNNLNMENIGIALAWTLFMSFFTYTSLWIDVLSVNTSILNTFPVRQSSLAALIVNFGIVIMLIFDYIKSSEVLHKKMFILFGVSMFLTIVSYAHSVIAIKNILEMFIPPFSYKSFGFIIHILFLVTMCGMKYVCLTMEDFTSKTLKRI